MSSQHTDTWVGSPVEVGSPSLLDREPIHRLLGFAADAVILCKQGKVVIYCTPKGGFG